jgi:hypothetical protein
MIFHDSTKKMVFKHQNKAKFKNLDDSGVLSSDFPGLTISTASMTLTASTASFHAKNTEYYVSNNPATKMTYPGLSMWNGSSKIHFFTKFWHPFSWTLEAVEAILRDKDKFQE